MPYRIPQSVAMRVLIKAYLSADHLTEATGLTIPVTISKNGAAFANPSAGATNATPIGSGWYYVDLSTIDTGTLGPLIVRGVLAGYDTMERVYYVVDAYNMGSAALPQAIPGAENGLATIAAGGAKLAQTVDLTSGQSIAASAIPNATVGGYAANQDPVTLMNADPPKVNVSKINDVTVQGTGVNGDEWGPA